jgi:hypothetical protein
VAAMNNFSSWSSPRTRFQFAAIICDELRTVMQRMELSLLAKLPSSQRSLITEGQPVVLEIVVTEAKNVEKPGQTTQE